MESDGRREKSRDQRREFLPEDLRLPDSERGQVKVGIIVVGLAQSVGGGHVPIGELNFNALRREKVKILPCFEL